MTTTQKRHPQHNRAQVKVVRPANWHIQPADELPPEPTGPTAAGMEGNYPDGFKGVGHPDEFYDHIDQLLTDVRSATPQKGN